MEKSYQRDRKSYNTREKSEENSNNEEQGGNQEIFIRNLNYNTTEPDLKSFFRKYGDIIKVRILQSEGKSKGSGFVHFKSSKDAQEVLKDSSNLEIDGRKVSVSWAQKSGSTNRSERERSRSTEKSYPKKQPSRDYKESSSREAPGAFTIFVGNLSFKIKESQVKDFFSDCGKVGNVRIAVQDGRSRGFCHVEFDSKEAYTAALEKNGQELDGRPLRVNEGRTQNSSRNSESRRY